MRKGKFGIVLCFYPIAAFAAVILNSPLICLALTAAAVFIERDEWAGRQTLQAWMASMLVFFFDKVVDWGAGIIRLPFLSGLLSVIYTVIFVVVYLAAIIFSILGIIRVMKDQEANVPFLSEFAYRVYGKRKPKPVAPPPVPQYQPYPPQQVPQQPQNPIPGQYQPPQYAPPAYAQPTQVPPPVPPQQVPVQEPSTSNPVYPQPSAPAQTQEQPLANESNSQQP